MKVKDLIRLWRYDVDDAQKPYLWSDDEATDFLDDAQNEACRRSHLLVDTQGATVARITLVAGQALYPLDPRVIFVRKARMTASVPLARKNEQDMAAYDPMWEDAQQQPTPRVFILDTDTGNIRFWPTPSQGGGTVFLTVVRLPLNPLVDPDQEPEINQRFHRSLRFWMTHRACMKPDEETFDPKKADQALELFEAEFGKKSSAIEENWIAREQYEGDGTY